MDGLSGQIIETGESGTIRPRDDNLPNVGEKRFGKINELFSAIKTVLVDLSNLVMLLYA